MGTALARRLESWIVNLRHSGLSAVSANTYICVMNAYWKWADTGLKVDYLNKRLASGTVV